MSQVMPRCLLSEPKLRAVSALGGHRGGCRSISSGSFLVGFSGYSEACCVQAGFCFQGCVYSTGKDLALVVLQKRKEKTNKINRWKSSGGRGHTGYLFKVLLRSNTNFQEAFHLELAEVYLAHVFCLFSIIFHSKAHLLPVLIPSIFDCIFPSTTLVATETTEMPQTAKLFRCGRNVQRREPSHGNEIFLPFYTSVEDG